MKVIGKITNQMVLGYMKLLIFLLNMKEIGKKESNKEEEYKNMKTDLFIKASFFMELSQEVEN